MSSASTVTSSSINPSTVDAKEIFELLESPQQFVVEDIKTLIQENINSTKDSWLVNGLYDYFIQCNSQPCMEILLAISREPQDKFLIEKIIESLRSQQSRKQSLLFLGHLVRKQPAWLHKIVTYGLVKELIKLMKHETDIVILMSGLLILTTILPMIPIYLISFVSDVFDVFGRLAVWTQSPNVQIEEHLLHLQVGLYSLFHRLYAMFPCNFLSYLRHNFSVPEKRHVFHSTVKPMLETVKMHPLLVTATKEWELSPSRWRNKEFHDIVAEYAEISLDVLESGSSEEFSPITLRPRLSTCTPASEATLTQKEERIPTIALPVSPLVQEALKLDSDKELTSISTHIEEAGGMSQTPLSSGGLSHAAPPAHSSTPVITTATATPQSTLKPSSPPEAGIEATPENTPITTPIKDRERMQFKLPAPGSPAVAQLTFGKASTNPPQTPPPTPLSSVPSSPAPHLNAAGGDAAISSSTSSSLHRRDSIFDSGLRRDSLMYQRLHKCMIEQQQQQQQSRYPARSEETSGANKPGPLTLGDTVITLEPLPGSATQGDSMTFGSGGDGPLTPLLGSHLEEIMDENDELTALHSLPEVHNMPDTRSMIAFARRVSRLRYYSHCTDASNTSAGSVGGPSPGTSPSSTSFMQSVKVKAKRSNSCPDVRKKSIFELTESTGDDSVDGPSIVSSTAGQQQQQEDDVIVGTMEPYEHLFEGVLPQFLQHPENKKAIQSPHVLLDLCLSKAASLHAPRKGEELAVLAGQIELLHCQLLFERHRRESHAMRNRHLAKKCRNIQQKEEQNCALRSQLHNMEKEVATLKKEIILQRAMATNKEKDMQQTIKDLESKLQNQKTENKSRVELISNLELKNAKVMQDYQTLLKETDQRKADIFQLESEVKHCKKYIDINSELRAAYESSQREILLFGELVRRQQEVIGSYEPHRYLLHEMEDLRLTCEEEIKSLRNMLESKASQTEAALGFIKNLEEQITKKDIILAEQKKLLQDSSAEYEIQIKALDEKYATVKKCNQRLEVEILNLQHQLSMRSFAIRTNNTSQRTRASPNGESPHNSIASDVDSAASAGGMQLSPDRSMLIFGSLQFDSPSATGEMNDLQRVIESEYGNGNESSSSRGRTVQQKSDNPQQYGGKKDC